MPSSTSTVTLHLGSHEKLRNRVNLYRMKEQREISPSTFAHLASSTLYERRWGEVAAFQSNLVWQSRALGSEHR